MPNFAGLPYWSTGSPPPQPPPGSPGAPSGPPPVPGGMPYAGQDPWETDADRMRKAWEVYQAQHPIYGPSTGREGPGSPGYQRNYGEGWGPGQWEHQGFNLDPFSGHFNMDPTYSGQTWKPDINAQGYQGYENYRPWAQPTQNDIRTGQAAPVLQPAQTPQNYQATPGAGRWGGGVSPGASSNPMFSNPYAGMSSDEASRRQAEYQQRQQQQQQQNFQQMFTPPPVRPGGPKQFIGRSFAPAKSGF